MNQGYIYILSNEALKHNLLKIGTTQLNPENRRAILSKSTAIPLDFKLEHNVRVKDNSIAEKRIHLLLKEYRFSDRKEFFQVDLDLAKKTINIIAEYMDIYERYSDMVFCHEDLLLAQYSKQRITGRSYGFMIVLRGLTINNTIADHILPLKKTVFDGFAEASMVAELMGITRTNAICIMRNFAAKYVDVKLTTQTGKEMRVFEDLRYGDAQLAWRYTPDYMRLFYNEKM
jgi:hypothetical protein